MMDRPNVLYKYTTYAAARAIIANSTLKLSVPMAFNDPFDILLEEALGSDVEEFLRDLIPAFFDVVSGELDHGALRPGNFRDTITKINQHLRRLPSEALTERRQEWLKQPLERVWTDLSFLRENNRIVVETIRGQLSTYGIFCTSINKDSLLMWAHYADHHRGLVLEFEPDLENDSALLASRPVRYSDERPLLYRTPRDILDKALFMSSDESAKSILEPLIYSKSTEWEYEEEFRLAIPCFIPPGASVEYLSFYPRELSRIYFGCRTPHIQQDELKALARARNPNVSFSRAVMARREYALDWVDD